MVFSAYVGCLPSLISLSYFLIPLGKNLIKTKDYFKKYFEGTNAVGETLDQDTMSFRVETMEMMLMSGIPIEKLDSMRSTLERQAKQTLTSSSNMRRLIPPMLQRELDSIMAECLGQDIVIIFDGTSEYLCNLLKRNQLNYSLP